MGFLRKSLVAGVAKFAVDQARKPQNQRKAKQMLMQLRSRKSPGPR